jgi:hypothetical protein
MGSGFRSFGSSFPTAVELAPAVLIAAEFGRRRNP